MIRKPETIRFWTGRLPHWEVEGGRYFITIHLAGAIPKPGRDRLRLLGEQPNRGTPYGAPDWLHRQRMIFREMEDWLDRCVWNPIFKQPAIANMVVEAIRHREQRGNWQVFDFVVMPTHVHLFAELGDEGMEWIMKDFKRWTGHQAAKILGVKDARIWQHEWFDHWSRSDEEDDRVSLYIRYNPLKAGLVLDYQDYPYGSWK